MLKTLFGVMILVFGSLPLHSVRIMDSSLADHIRSGNVHVLSLPGNKTGILVSKGTLIFQAFSEEASGGELFSIGGMPQFDEYLGAKLAIPSLVRTEIVLVGKFQNRWWAHLGYVDDLLNWVTLSSVLLSSAVTSFELSRVEGDLYAVFSLDSLLQVFKITESEQWTQWAEKELGESVLSVELRALPSVSGRLMLGMISLEGDRFSALELRVGGALKTAPLVQGQGRVSWSYSFLSENEVRIEALCENLAWAWDFSSLTVETRNSLALSEDVARGATVFPLGTSQWLLLSESGARYFVSRSADKILPLTGATMGFPIVTNDLESSDGGRLVCLIQNTASLDFEYEIRSWNSYGVSDPQEIRKLFLTKDSSKLIEYEGSNSWRFLSASGAEGKVSEVVFWNWENSSLNRQSRIPEESVTGAQLTFADPRSLYLAAAVNLSPGLVWAGLDNLNRVWILGSDSEGVFYFLEAVK